MQLCKGETLVTRFWWGKTLAGPNFAHVLNPWVFNSKQRFKPSLLLKAPRRREDFVAFVHQAFGGILPPFSRQEKALYIHVSFAFSLLLNPPLFKQGNFVWGGQKMDTKIPSQSNFCQLLF